jgi:hypothetical protein
VFRGATCLLEPHAGVGFQILKVLLFRPFAGIRPHALLESGLATSLLESNEITEVHCRQTFQDFCPTHQNFGLNPESPFTEKQKICGLCINSSKKPRKNTDRETMYIDDFLFKDDIKYIEKKLKKLSKLLEDNDFDLKSCIKLKFVKEILYDLTLKYKKRDLKVNPGELNYFLLSYRHNLITEIAAKRILKVSKPQVVLIFTPQYSINASFAIAAKKLDIPVYYMAGNGSLSEMHRTLRIWSWDNFKCMDPALLYWKPNLIKLSKSDKKRIDEHFKTITLGKSVFTYSPKGNNATIKEFFKISADSKIILVAMSSYDEFLASKYSGYLPENRLNSRVFGNQTEWIRSLIEWGASHKEFTFIIRPHPREFPNRRDGIKAKLNMELMDVLKDLPENFRIDYPENKFSMDQYYKEISALTVSWSSVATEALYRNIPVVSYDKDLVMIPSETHLTGKTRGEYWDNLISINLQKETDYKEMLSQWFAFSNFVGSAEFRNGFIQSRIASYAPILKSLFYRIERVYPKIIYKIDTFFRSRGKDTQKIEDLLKGSHISFFESKYHQNSDDNTFKKTR